MPDFEYDVFVVHASEDKSAFVEPLVNSLKQHGLAVWYDRFSLRVGDSLHASIELGLSRSRFGVVVFSPAFFAKRWPAAELNGLVAREMAGDKVILPIWHQITREDILRELPILADKVALRSGDGFASVAISLVEAIRPELLEVRKSAEDAVVAGKRLADAVSRDHPGYEVRMTTGASVSFGNCGPRPEGAIASIYRDGSRADVLVSDPKKLPEPPHIKIGLSRAGIEKLRDGLRTGKEQTLSSGEFRIGGGSIPLMPSANDLDKGILTIKPNVAGFSEPDVRLEIDADSGPITVSPMRMKVERAGTDEVAFRLYHPRRPFSICFVVGLQPQSELRDITIETSFASFAFAQVESCVKIVSAIMAGAEFHVLNPATDGVLLRAALLPEPDWIESGIASLISMVASIERHFRVSIPWPSRMPDEEIEKAIILDCLISGSEFCSNLELTFDFIKSPNLTLQARSWKHGPAALFMPPNSRGEEFSLFGTPIIVPEWGLYTAQVSPVDIEAALNAVEAAPEGSHLSINMRGLTPTYVRLKSSLSPTAFSPGS